MGQQIGFDLGGYKPPQSVHYESELQKWKHSNHIKDKQTSNEVILPDFRYFFIISLS